MQRVLSADLGAALNPCCFIILIPYAYNLWIWSGEVEDEELQF